TPVQDAIGGQDPLPEKNSSNAREHVGQVDNGTEELLAGQIDVEQQGNANGNDDDDWGLDDDHPEGVVEGLPEEGIIKKDPLVVVQANPLRCGRDVVPGEPSVQGKEHGAKCED